MLSGSRVSRTLSPLYGRWIGKKCYSKPQNPLVRDTTRFSRPTVAVFTGLGLGMAVSLLYWQNDTAHKFLDGTVRLSASLWTGACVSADYKYSLYGIEPNSEEEEAIYKIVHKRAAKKVLELCEHNGGLYVKAGQYLASLNHILPKEYVDTLSILQDGAPSQSFDMVERVFSKDFNKPIKDCFQSFEKVPIAAASLAQVHRAVTLDGKEVAVKVQYEQLKGQFGGDMLAHRIIFYLLAKLFPGFDFTFSEEEMQIVLATELDFVHEAQNSDRAKKNMTIDHVYIPEVYHKLSSDRVLTTEFIHGCKINDVDAIKDLGLDVSRVAKSLLEGFSEQIFRHGFFHADPHPGNILVREDPDHAGIHQVVILDHGLYKEMDENLRLTWCKLWKGMVEKNSQTIEECAIELNVNPNCKDDLVMMILMRAHNDSTRVGLGSSMTAEEVEQLRANAREKMGDIVEILRVVPPAVWLILRNNNLLRSINQDLGVPVNRFLIMARSAVSGLGRSTNNEENISYADWFSSLWTKTKFESHLSYFLFSYWVTDIFFSFLIAIGKVKEVELEELVKAA